MPWEVLIYKSKKNMNLIEAIKSGKPFRREGFTSYYDPKTYDRYYSHDEVIADDWQVKSEPVTITRQQLEAAWREVIGWSEPNGALIFDGIAKQLGL